ncbi:hypothetical protein EOL70_05525 [Leucothrix sargassi]|nr:hypothetical protein EOL70_05525 [Leucothrix sargassi]
MSITQLKIFGERNSGTNWVEETVMSNYEVSLVHHRGVIGKSITDEQRALLRMYGQQERRFIRERFIDAIFEEQFVQFFGWKHSCVDYNLLRDCPSFNETGFIFLVKNPYSFIKSLHQKPYHELLNVPDSLDSFVSSPWLAVQRDLIANPLLETPVELWNYKVSSYFKFMKYSKNSLLLKYEDLLSDPHCLFEAIESRFSISAVNKTVITKSTKSDVLSINDYRKKYLIDDPKDGLSEVSLDFMKGAIDLQVAGACGYEI